MRALYRRVCVIGSSYVGAVRKAYESGDRSRGEGWSFFANGGRHYANLEVARHRIANAPYNSGGSTNVDDYDVFVVYGAAPTPRRCLMTNRGLSPLRYSSRARAAAFRQWFFGFKSPRIVASLIALTGKPVLMLSANVPHDQSIGSDEENRDGAALIAAAISPGVYVPFPNELFAPDGRPKPEYFLGSLDIAGIEPDREKQPGHHLHHLNQAGGALVLAQIIRHMEHL